MNSTLTFPAPLTGAVPARMRAVVPARGGGPEVLDILEVDVPQPGAGEVLIQVAAAGINRHDVSQRRRGTPPPGATSTLGLEVAGRVVRCGPDAPASLVGTQVVALVNGGGYADYCVADARLVLPAPAGLTAVQAASLPEALFTFWLNAVILGGLKAGQWLLIQGGASGVGTAGIQVAKALGARVAVTAGTDEKCASCTALGADVATNYRSGDFVADVMQATNGAGVQVILDMVGGLYAQRNVDVLAMDGRLVHITNAQTSVFSATLESILRKRAVVTGSLLRGLENARKYELADELRQRAWPLLGSGIKPVVHATFALDQVREAHALMDTGTHTGKIMLAVA